MSGLLKAGIIRGRPHGARAEKAVPFPSPAFKHLRSDLIKMSAIAASTPIWSRLAPDAEKMAMLEKDLSTTIPLNRLADADEIANAVMFLASNESTYLTGSEIVVDGGSTGSPLVRPLTTNFAETQIACAGGNHCSSERPHQEHATSTQYKETQTS